MSREELAAAIDAHYPDKPPTTRALYANMIWNFYHEISQGDFVIARRGLKTLVAVGEVVRTAFYAPGKSPVNEHPNYMEIAWSLPPRNKTYPTLVFQRRTVVELPEQKYSMLLEGNAPAAEAPEPTEDVEDKNEFVLEKYLEDFIISNFDAIFRGKLKIYEDTEEGEGQQYDTNEIGRIDILTLEPAANSFVVIELKKGQSSDRVIGQTLRYMGWVKKNLCTNGQAVRGLVICRNHSAKPSYALEMTKDIDVRYYNVSFKLMETPWQREAGVEL
jgi:restriction system protein